MNFGTSNLHLLWNWEEVEEDEHSFSFHCVTTVANIDSIKEGSEFSKVIVLKSGGLCKFFNENGCAGEITFGVSVPGISVDGTRI